METDLFHIICEIDISSTLKCIYIGILSENIFLYEFQQQKENWVFLSTSLVCSDGMDSKRFLFLPENVAILCLICDLAKNKYNCNILKKGAEASVVLISITMASITFALMLLSFLVVHSI